MAKITPDDVLRVLRSHPQAGSAELCRLLGDINRSTLARAMQAVSAQVVVRGGSRRIRYSLRRSLRGSVEPLALYRIDDRGQAQQAGWLDLTWPQGSALDYLNPWPWPVEDGMCDGWYEGLPYPLLDMRPQGFIGRHFARQHALDLHLPDNPDLWNDDEVTYALSVQGHDQPGDLILGEASYRRLLAARQAGVAPLEDS
ncbi:MAG: putative kinase YjjJ, partial [Pseudomonadota bacterium]